MEANDLAGAPSNGANGGGKPIMGPQAWEDEPTNPGIKTQQKEESAATKALDDVVGTGEVFDEEVFQQRRASLRKAGIFIDQLETAYESVSGLVTELTEKDVAMYYTKTERAILAVAGLFEETKAYATKRVNRRVIKSFRDRVYGKVTEAEGLFREQYVNCNSKVSSLDERIGTVSATVNELTASGEEYRLKIAGVREEVDQLQQDLLDAEDSGDFEAATVYRTEKSKKEQELNTYSLEGVQVLSRLRGYQSQTKAMNGAANGLRELASYIQVRYSALLDAKTQLELAGEMQEFDLGSIETALNGDSGNVLRHGAKQVDAVYGSFQKGIDTLRDAADRNPVTALYDPKLPTVGSNASDMFERMYAEVRTVAK